MSNGPMNRKKKVTGTASADSMQTHGEGRQEGPVGQQDGYQERKDQAQQHGRGNAGQQPFSRPTGQTGAFQGSMNTQGGGMGSARPQQSRPSASSQQSARPMGMGSASPYQQARPQQQQQPQGYEQLGQQQSAQSGGNATRASGKSGCSPILIIGVLAVLLLGGGGLSGIFGNLFGGGNSGDSKHQNEAERQNKNGFFHQDTPFLQSIDDFQFFPRKSEG